MDKTKIGGTGVKLPPLRSLNDFLLESARFQIPSGDLDKWGSRIVQNLLYYQTNYIFLSLILFLIVGLFHPGKMLVGMVAIGTVIAIFAYVSTEGRAIHNFRKQNPIAGIIVIILGGCFVTYTLGSLLICLVAILLPFCVIFIHASLRLRNLQNKIANKIEGIGLRRTPMGIFLEQLDDVASIKLKAQSSYTVKATTTK
ncbi:PRA1 family protein 2 isoform X2 [Chelonus insularis]|uniref:PRA1 family protein 2 isoform X2 n=1 Tax=Chelonus insularis TaxID=460826 RepID=UPI00158EB09E|nr:PRA1 family protein 2 isoform X2 [Chelonus insularis]